MRNFYRTEKLCQAHIVKEPGAQFQPSFGQKIVFLKGKGLRSWLAVKITTTIPESGSDLDEELEQEAASL